jgi:uncharacterized protein (DUF2267 family)
VTENQRTVDAFETTMRTSYGWIRDYGEALGQTHAGLCYRCLRAGLHAIRDRLPVDESVAFAAQLPLLVRGVWFEGWHPARVPVRAHSMAEVHAEIARALEGGLGASPGHVLSATFAVLDRHGDPRALRNVRALLPDAMRHAWPEHVATDVAGLWRPAI